MHGRELRRVVIASRCAWTTFNFRRHLIEELTATGVEVVACGAGGDGYEERLQAIGVRFVRMPLAKRSVSVLADLRYLLACWRLLRQVRPDVVHAFTIKPVIFCSIAAAIVRVPVRVAMITGLGYSFTSSGAWLRRVVQGLYRVALRRIHRVYFQNATDRDDFFALGLVSARQCRMIAGSGVDTKTFVPVDRPDVAGAPVFLMVSRVLREKGVNEFFDAARRVRLTGQPARFVLAGGTDYRNPTSMSDQEVRDAAGDAGVEWVGQVDNVRDYLANADVVVLPSYREGTPMSLLEASAMAKPMIATDVPGCRDVVRAGWNGWLVPPRDSEALASAMQQSIRDRHRWKSFGENARLLATSRFDARLVCRQLIDDYRALLMRGDD
jgi:glycosyltransferase involved in cell wall biosynthesis